MHPKRPPVPVIVVLLVALLVGGYFGLQALFVENNGGLQASGTIEAVKVSVSPEMAGKVTDVLAGEGDPINAGDPLLHLDESLLTAQRSVASAQVDSARATAVTADAALTAAQTRYNQAFQSAMAAEQDRQSQDWRFSAPDEFDQPSWYFIQSEQLDSIQVELDAARLALDDALGNLEAVVNDLDNADFLETEKKLKDLRTAFLVARDVKIQAEYAAESGGLLDAAYDSYNDILDELNDIEREYNAFLTTQAARDVQDARGKVVVAQQRYNTAYARFLSLQTGEYAPSVVNAKDALDQAQASAEQAHTAVTQAEANLALIDTQISKLVAYSPVSGTVLTRNLEPGEFVQPGATAFTLANLEDLTITVYVPEDRYGEISLGQQAEVKVDSFPNEAFSASVTYISDSAEYTPRNVQTVEGRSATVYAIKLKVDDPAGKLKPGMPADVLFR